MVSEAKHKAKNEGKGFKILTPKQLLQILTIALAQLKGGNNTEFIERNQTNRIQILCINQNKSLKKYRIT